MGNLCMARCGAMWRDVARRGDHGLLDSELWGDMARYSDELSRGCSAVLTALAALVRTRCAPRTLRDPAFTQTHRSPGPSSWGQDAHAQAAEKGETERRPTAQ